MKLENMITVGIILILATASVCRGHQFSRSGTQVSAFSNTYNVDRDEILDGVQFVGLSGYTGFLSVYDESSCTVMAGLTASKDPVRLPVAVSGRFGNSRMIGFGHDNFMTPEDVNSPGAPTDKNTFIMNVLRWAAGGFIRNVALVPTFNDGNNDKLIPFLNEKGISVTVILAEELANSAGLEGYEVVCIKGFFNLDSVPVLKQYVDNGGGLVMALTSWAHYVNGEVEGEFASNWGPNIISKDFGFVWWKEEAGGGSGPDGSFDTSSSQIVDTTFPEVWSKVKAIFNGALPNGTEELGQVTTVFETSTLNIPRTFFKEAELYNDFLSLINGSEQPLPTENEPVLSLWNKFKLQVFHAIATVLKPEDVAVHPSSSTFPGNVSGSRAVENDKYFVTVSFNEPTWSFEGKQRGTPVHRYVTRFRDEFDTELKFGQNILDTWYSDGSLKATEKAVEEFPVWYSTGLYAEAGSIVKAGIVSNPSNITSAITLQIGTHTDDISVRREWYRAPKITMRTDFVDGIATLVSPYGGTIFIKTSRGLGSGNQTAVFSFTGTVKTPYFKLGDTTNREWKEFIRNYPGAWAELATNKVIISTSTSSIQDLDDPEALLIFWDEVMDAMSDLAMIPRERHHPERIVPDVQISAGSMHSGYPVMTFLIDGRYPINLTLLRTEGSWGHFHELGHNLQQSAWTFDGTGEVTCNLFAIYVMNNVCGIPTSQTRYELTPESYLPDIIEYIESGLNFDLWKARPFMALMFYVQLQETFGWTAFKKVFAEYHLLSDEELPTTDQDKMDMWLIKFSQAVKENLFDFFLSWGIPISDGVSEQLTQYPSANISMLHLL